MARCGMKRIFSRSTILISTIITIVLFFNRVNIGSSQNFFVRPGDITNKSVILTQGQVGSDAKNISSRKNDCKWMLRNDWKPNIDQHDYGYVINPVNKCNWTRRELAENSTTILLLVSSAMHNIRRRKTVRSTWLKWSIENKMPTRTLFLLGSSLDQKKMDIIKLESDTFGDIVQEDFIDSYYNLTLKTVMAFKWAATFCNHADFVMKMDDDGILNVESLVKDMSTAPTKFRSDYFAGPRVHAKPIRHSKNKWCIPVSLYPQDFYPPYPLGVGYIFSIDMARKLWDTSKEIVTFPIDDVYIGILLQKIGIELRSINSMYYFTIYFSFSTKVIKTEASLLALTRGYLTWNVALSSTATQIWDAILNKRWPKLEGKSKCDIKCVKNAGYLP